MIDAAKIRRAKQRIGFKEVEERDTDNLKCIGLDGKEDKGTKVVKKTEIEGETYVTKTTDKVEHYSFTIESGTLSILYIYQPNNKTFYEISFYKSIYLTINQIIYPIINLFI